MPIAELLAGVMALVAVLGPLVFGAVRLRDALLPEADWVTGFVVIAVLVTSGLVIDAQLCGAVGQLRTVPLVLGAAVLGAGAVATARRLDPVDTVPDPPPIALHPAARLLSFLPAILAIAQLVTGVAYTMPRGFLDADSIAYHMPFAGRLAQIASTTDLHYVAIEQAITFYPINGELLHGTLLTLIGVDLLSPFFNLGLLAVFFAVAWSFGRRTGHPHLALASAGVFVASPLWSAHLGGTALHDLFGITFLAAAALLVSRYPGRVPVLAIAGLSAGLAAGSKFSWLAPAGILTIAVIATQARRLVPAIAWLAGMAATGAFWYLRNWFTVGNPIPPLGVELGPVELRETEFAVSQLDHAVVEFLTDRAVVADVYVPGLRSDFGVLWWLLLLLVAVGAVGAIVAGYDRRHRVLGVVALACAAAYLVTPGSALGRFGIPEIGYFASAVRYAGSAVVFGLLLLPGVRWVAGRTAQHCLLAAFLAVAAGYHVGTNTLWYTFRPGTNRLPGVLAAAGVVAIGWAISRLGSERRRQLAVPAAVLVVAVSVASLLRTNDVWANRYQADASSDAFPRLYDWARDVDDARIGIVGFFQQYPLYGSDVSNFVQPVGAEGPHGEFKLIERCDDWMAALDRGRFDYVVAAPFNVAGDPPEQEGWTAASPAASPVFEDGPITVFAVDGRFDASDCPPGT